MRWARFEPLASVTLAVLVALPMLLVHYAPIDDGPEHLLGPWLEMELERPGSLASTWYTPSGSPPTYFVMPLVIRLGLSIVEPAMLLRWIAFLLPVALLFALRANLEGARPEQKLTAVLIASLLVLDVSYYKGFLSFYFGVVTLFLATAALTRARTARLRRWPFAYAILALVCLLAHPLSYVMLGLIVGLRLLFRDRDPRWLMRVALWSLPSLVAAIMILAVLVRGNDPTAHGLSANYLFGPVAKARGFFREGWACLGRWQLWLAAATFGLAALSWLSRDLGEASRWARFRPPPLTTALALLYLVLPEEFGGWSWISIRVPLLVAMCAAWEVGQSKPPAVGALGAKIRAVVLPAGVLLWAASTTLSGRATLRLSEAIEDLVASSAVIPERSVLLTFLPSTYPEVGRVNVLHHAPAYLAIAKAVVYPEVFAKDARQHRCIVKPERQSEVFGFGPALDWHAYVSADVRASWFEGHPGTIAVAFEADPAIATRLRAASRDVKKVNDRVTVYFGRETPSP